MPQKNAKTRQFFLCATPTSIACFPKLLFPIRCQVVPHLFFKKAMNHCNLACHLSLKNLCKVAHEFYLDVSGVFKSFLLYYTKKCCSYNACQLRKCRGFFIDISEVFSSCSFIVEEWGPCSSPCGEGIRERQVQCKIFLEFSKTVAVLPDHECPGPKPPTTEICFSGLCQEGANGKIMQEPITAPLIHNVQKDVPHHRLDLDLDSKVYKWKDVGFTACSESCLGGLQESKIICINDREDPVSPMHCDMSERPEVIVQTCNDHPCPPRYTICVYSPRSL